MGKLNKIYLIVGESGSGKDSLVNVICDEWKVHKAVSYTTREPRTDDENDIGSHNFVTLTDYERDKENRIVIADTFFNGNYYWTTSLQINDCSFYIIDPKGLKKFINNYCCLLPKEHRREYKVVYIKSKPIDRIKRTYRREARDSMSIKDKLILMKKVLSRFMNDLKEFDGFERRADYVVRNEQGQFNNASRELDYIVLNEGFDGVIIN